MTKRRIPFRDAVDLVSDDLPDGAFFAMAAEMAGVDYGCGFEDLAVDVVQTAASARRKPFACLVCGKRFRLETAEAQHRKDAHGEGTLDIPY